MKKRNRLKKNEDFQKVFKHGTSVANRQFVLYTLDQPENDELRVGLSVSKKIGNAVMRNRIKRLIRQAFLEEKERLKEKDYIIIARKPASQLTFEETKKVCSIYSESLHYIRNLRQSRHHHAFLQLLKALPFWLIRKRHHLKLKDAKIHTSMLCNKRV